MSPQHAKTQLLDIVYEEGGVTDAPAILLLHGWPDDIRGWRQVAPRLHAAGYRTITPYLRGFGLTRFLSQQAVRDGRGVALAHDAIDLADALSIQRFAVVGHDWGARAAYTLAALFPDRVTSIAGIALAYQPRAKFHIPRFSQARRFWYQWLMALDQGAAEVRRDPVGFARIQWETWSPPGWFSKSDFAETAKSFRNPDWVAITLHGYRSRWLNEPGDQRYAESQQRLESIDALQTPTLMIQGGGDRCDEPASSEGLERYFRGPYRRIVLDAVGHFPPREAPERVADAVVEHLRESFPPASAKGS
jgi:pimeloyl-ACP methyl ester carboxylesterase